MKKKQEKKYSKILKKLEENGKICNVKILTSVVVIQRENEREKEKEKRKVYELMLKLQKLLFKH